MDDILQAIHRTCDSVGVPKEKDGVELSADTRVLIMSLMLRGRVDTAAVIGPLVDSLKKPTTSEAPLRTILRSQVVGRTISKVTNEYVQEEHGVLAVCIYFTDSTRWVIPIGPAESIE